MKKLVACLLLLTACLCPFKASSQVARIPLRYDPIWTPSPIVNVKINDLPPLPFIIDSGSTFQFVINEAVALKNNLVRGKKVMTDQSGRAYYQCEIRQIAMITEQQKLAGFQTQEIMMADFGSTFDNYQADQPIAGVIGGALFELCAIRWDFDQQVMEITLKSEGFVHKADAIRIPLIVHRTGESEVIVVETQIGKKKIKMRVDTGAAHCILSDTLKNEVAQNSFAESEQEYEPAEGKQMLPIYLLKELKIGKAQVALVEVALSPSKKDYGLLGMNWLSRFRVTLDHLQNVMILEPRAPETLFVEGQAEASLEEKDGRFIVTEVEAQSQSARAGLQVGDSVVSIDGKKVERINIAVAQRMIIGEAGKRAELIVERKVAGSDKPARVLITFLRKANLSEFLKK